MLRPTPTSKRASEPREALRSSRRAFACVGVFSAGVNILALTGSVYMLQLYDRVVPAHSVPSLVGLTLIMLLLCAGFGVFDFQRSQVLSRIGVRFERTLRERVFSTVILKPLRSAGSGCWERLAASFCLAWRPSPNSRPARRRDSSRSFPCR